MPRIKKLTIKNILIFYINSLKLSLIGYFNIILILLNAVYLNPCIFMHIPFYY